MTKPRGPLQRVKVVACSTAQAGTVPYMLMADLGAEVIKIEVPEVGDNSRGSTVMPGFPARRGGEERLWLRRTEEGEPEARLYVGLGLRPQGTPCRSAGHRFDGAGA